jgi:hypothetical protein
MGISNVIDTVVTLEQGKVGVRHCFIAFLISNVISSGMNL